MAKGAKQKSNVILMATGSKHARPLEPKYSTPIGKPPAILTGIALETWKKVVKAMKEAGTIANVDEESLTCYCMATKDLHDSEKDIEEYGRIVETERGLVKNPAFTIRNSAMTQIKQFACEFGLTPASRGKVKGKPAEKQSKFSDL